MNLEESNRIYHENKQKNTKKKGIIASIVLCFIIMVVCLIIIFMLQKIEENRFKTLLDGKEVSINEDTIKKVFIISDEAGNKYINLKMLAQLTGYNYTKGDYIEVNEDINSCYLENNYEIVSFKAEESLFIKYAKNNETSTNDTEASKNSNQNIEKKDEIKYTVKSKDGEKEIFKINLPIILKEEEIYIPMESVNLACNTTISLTEKGLNINTLDYMVRLGQSYAAQKRYSVISSDYENVKTIPNNMLVVGDGSKYGVISLETGKELLGLKYDRVKYLQNENKFYIYVDNKVGLIDADGTMIISPKDYDSIETFDVDKNLYLVQEDGKYGLLNLEGNPVLHSDYDQIGISDIEEFDIESTTNENLWFDKIIPIKQGSVWGLYNIERKEIVLPMNYSGFVYQIKSTDTLGEDNVLLIPKETGVEGVVLILNGQYGIFDIKKQEEIIPCVCNRIYSITTNGITKYYMEFNGYQLEMREYFESHDLISVEE